MNENETTDQPVKQPMTQPMTQPITQSGRAGSGFNRRKIGGGLVVALLLLLVLAIFQFPAARERRARHTLDRMLGEALTPSAPAPGNILPDEQETPDNRDPGEQGNDFFDWPIPALNDTGVNVQETPERYVLRVPLAKPHDADGIRLNVTPHRIEISGKTASGKDGATVQSSFLQSFSTSEEVLPGAVGRRIEKRNDRPELIITIPKKRTNGSPRTKPEPALPGDLPQEIPLGNPDEHKVI